MFTLVEDHIADPLEIYHGFETSRVTFQYRQGAKEIPFEIDLDKPEVRQWRHFYSDEELNHLSRLFKFNFVFVLNHELAVNPKSRRAIRIQPFYHDGSEYSVCFTYDELSPLQYKYWLIGIAHRNVSLDEFEARIRQILKFWIK